MKQKIAFTLKPADSEIPALMQGYHQVPANVSDEKCFEAGALIRSGDVSKENLRVIYRWKMQSRSYLGQERKFFDKNSDEAVANVLRATIDAIDKRGDTERAFRELQSLKGVKLAVASAILTAVFPDHFTVIDIMAFRALGVTPLSVPLYLHYLAFCRQQAERLGISLRDMDRALWQWGHDNPP